MRVRAYLIDYFLLLGLFLLVTAVGPTIERLTGASAVLFWAWLVCALLYEPVMVWRTGATLGHHLKNLHVVSERTGRHPSLSLAALRSLVKWLLGGISMLLMLGSERQQAIHDAVANVTVRFRDPTLARRRDYVRAPTS